MVCVCLAGLQTFKLAWPHGRGIAAALSPMRDAASSLAQSQQPHEAAYTVAQHLQQQSVITTVIPIPALFLIDLTLLLV